MSTRTDYLPDDWETLKNALTRTPVLVMAVSPQGPVGLLRESAAIYTALSQALQHGTGYPLIADLRLELQAAKPALPQADDAADVISPAATAEVARTGQKPQRSLEVIRRETVDRCRRAALILAKTAGEDEADYFKRALLWVCWQTAQAAREGGGMFGIGGVRVTDAEREALRQIAFALGVAASEAVVERLPDAPAQPAPAALGGLLTAEEWALVRQAPLWTGFAVAAGHPSGPIGLAREINAIQYALQNQQNQASGSSLLAALRDDLNAQLGEAFRTVVAGLPTGPDGAPKLLQDPPGMLEHCLEKLSETAEMVDARLPLSEAIAFKRELIDLAHRVAEAAREDTVLGIGGQRVSEREQDVLRRIDASLRV